MWLGWSDEGKDTQYAQRNLQENVPFQGRKGDGKLTLSRVFKKQIGKVGGDKKLGQGNCGVAVRYVSVNYVTWSQELALGRGLQPEYDEKTLIMVY